jgi:hypothetical protein
MKTDTQRLPTLFQLIQALKRLNEDACLRNAWSENSGLAMIASIPKWSLPMKEFVNDAGDEKFIVIQTQRGRHTLKPNLVRRHFLYRGQHTQYPYVLSSFSRDDLPDRNGKQNFQKARDKHLVANLKAEEFIFLLQQHPLFMMLDRGICLEPEKKPIFLNMNYSGLAQHYGFKTGLVDFTTELEVAAFFACTENVGYDEYRPITDVKRFPQGVIYVHSIQPDFSFKMMGFSTIGLQLFPRSGAQKGVLFNEGIQPVPLDNLVQAFPFRHDATVSQHFYKIMEGGRRLFPVDSIARYAQQILDSNEVSGCVFAENLYGNQDDLTQNLEALQREGIHVDWLKRPHFTQEMLNDLELDLKNGLWEQFCKQIYFADAHKGDQMLESLLKLPQNPSYAHYFKKKEYPRIAYSDELLREQAERNKKMQRS